MKARMGAGREVLAKGGRDEKVKSAREWSRKGITNYIMEEREERVGGRNLNRQGAINRDELEIMKRSSDSR